MADPAPAGWRLQTPTASIETVDPLEYLALALRATTSHHLLSSVDMQLPRRATAVRKPWTLPVLGRYSQLCQDGPLYGKYHDRNSIGAAFPSKQNI